jgi:hypothetical protein
LHGRAIEDRLTRPGLRIFTILQHQQRLVSEQARLGGCHPE